MFLNSILEDKQEDQDKFININDINIYYKIDEESLNNQYQNIRELFDMCAKIPKKFSLNIIELNYLYCAIVWKNGFENFSDRLFPDFESKKKTDPNAYAITAGYLKIVE